MSSIVPVAFCRLRKHEMNQGRRFTLAHGVVISLLLHVCLALPFVALSMHTPRRQRHSSNRLNIELFGMLSNRQAEAQQMRVEARPGQSAPRKQDTPEAKPQTVQKEAAPSEAHVVMSGPSGDTPDAVKLPGIPAAPDNGSPSSGVQGRAGGDSQQRQQFIGRRPDAADLLNAYVSQLSKKVHSNQKYPPEAKKKRQEGYPEISFVVTESGEIKPNTLRVTKSSGYALIDTDALKTAAVSAPFPKPPRELSVSITLAYETDR
jgi:protein TonB